MTGPERQRIFLYGTLRRGGTRDAGTHYEGVEFVGCARVRGLLYDLGAYPGLQLRADGGWVVGELFDIPLSTLAQLDDWEGIDSDVPGSGEYLRAMIAVERESCGAETCWGYEIKPEVCKGRPIIASGDWIEYLARRG